jgi:hypothetical protein
MDTLNTDLSVQHKAVKTTKIQMLQASQKQQAKRSPISNRPAAKKVCKVHVISTCGSQARTMELPPVSNMFEDVVLQF